jgi:hypothetical protein
MADKTDAHCSIITVRRHITVGVKRMALFRKRPVEVEASQWLGPGTAPIPGVFVDGDPDDPASYHVVTTHGQRTRLAPGDWVIAEPDGNGHYPCKDGVFVSLYDPIPQSWGGFPNRPPGGTDQDERNRLLMIVGEVLLGVPPPDSFQEAFQRIKGMLEETNPRAK